MAAEGKIAYALVHLQQMWEVVWSGKARRALVFCAEKYKIKSFIVFYLQFNMKSLNAVFYTSTLFSLTSG